MIEILCHECEGKRIDVDICGCCERDCYMCGGSGLSGEALAWCRDAERSVTDPTRAFHTIRLGCEEIWRRRLPFV